MAFKIPVEDRVPTYAGRVKLTPVSGETNMYDMVRADMPITEGTPINKALFDNKAYTLTSDVTVYVSTSGSDTNGSGDLDAPFRTIQAAIDALPKNMDGYTATVNITAGTYDERVVCRGFIGGKLVVGITSQAVIIRGLEIDACSHVEVNVGTISWGGIAGDALLSVKNGSRVFIPNDLTLSGGDNNIGGIYAQRGSVVSAARYHTIVINNCLSVAAAATMCGVLTFAAVTGSGNFVGLSASMGGLITYETNTLGSDFGDNADTGGRIQTGGGVSALADASVE